MTLLVKRTDGHLSKLANGHLAKCTRCPCRDYLPLYDDWNALYLSGTPVGSLVQCYQLDGYVDGDLLACAECDVNTGTAWEGKFYAMAPGAMCRFGSPNSQPKINGKKIYSAGIIAPTVQSPMGDSWQLLIQCDDGGSPVTIWNGYSPIGQCTPVGIYTRTDGCEITSNPSTLSIVACP